MYIALAILAVVAVYAIVVYNGLVKSRQMTEEAWSGIDVQLKRRADLVPNLIETVKGYASHEKETLENVINLRNRAQACRRAISRGVRRPKACSARRWAGSWRWPRPIRT